MSTAWHDYGSDIYTEPDGDPNTLPNLGPLRAMAGVFEGAMGADTHPVAEGIQHDQFVEHNELDPIDFQTNGPQLFYGLRYHTHIVKPGEPPTFHDQVGYWLWEPAAQMITLTLGIPRGQALVAYGPAAPDATNFEVKAVPGSETNGIVSNPFLDQAFRTLSYRIYVIVYDDDSWSYEEEGVLHIPGRPAPFPHIDRNTLHRVGPPRPNPLSLVMPTAVSQAANSGRGPDFSLGIGSLRKWSGPHGSGPHGSGPRTHGTPGKDSLRQSAPPPPRCARVYGSDEDALSIEAR